MFKLDGFNAEHFLSNYWQKKPLLLRKAFSAFDDVLDENDLAGLAMEPDIDSRIIRNHERNWHVDHGPFESFEPYCTGLWTLLVQGVDRYLPEADSLMQAFNFIPSWRQDDLMVSYAVPGAGVGPHTDQYDVFLIQGKGKRHWRVGFPSDDYTNCCPHPNLQQISGFDACIDVELNTGDMLYIPPNWPHEGTAISNCITYSVGFRAPDCEELTQALTDTIYNLPTKGRRYEDPDLTTRQNSAEITPEEIESLTAMMKSTLDSEAWKKTLIGQLSDQNLHIEPLEHEIDAIELQTHLANGLSLHFITGCKPLIAFNTLFVNREAFVYLPKDHLLMCRLANTKTLNNEDFDNIAHTKDFISICVELVNKGYLTLDE